MTRATWMASSWNRDDSTEIRRSGGRGHRAGRGLGRAYALLLASRGAKVVVNDIGSSLTGDGMDPSPAHRVVAEIRAAGGDAVACVESVATAAGGQAIIQTALEHYGRIDVLIHNAGTVRRASLKEMSYQDFDSVIDVHLRGAFHVVRGVPAHVCCALRPYRIDVVDRRPLRQSWRGQLRRRQSRPGGPVQCRGARGSPEGVLCNVIVPAAVTRMAEGLDISAYPPMGQSWWHRSSGCWRTNHARSPAKCWWRWPAGGHRGGGRIARVRIVRRGRSRTWPSTSATSATSRTLRFFRWCRTVTANTSDTASRWPRAVADCDMPSNNAGRWPGARRRSDRNGDGPLLHPDHGRHGCRRHQGGAAERRRHRYISVGPPAE
ncbi:short chain dehydrogenase family protein [Mycobacterium kansasii]|uniref:Short chain dehydrogenase family protein n=1 Tax=Mycobacterium kansasii TaxID=1768 RepID=A0A1V3WAH8_MYCKA|nr:short chain dehydrogenase family protein [Mycobacterium kansasii]